MPINLAASSSVMPGSMPANARTIWDEGLRIPPVRIYDKGVLNEGVLAIMLNAEAMWRFAAREPKLQRLPKRWLLEASLFRLASPMYSGLASIP